MDQLAAAERAERALQKTTRVDFGKKSFNVRASGRPLQNAVAKTFDGIVTVSGLKDAVDAREGRCNETLNPEP